MHFRRRRKQTRGAFPAGRAPRDGFHRVGPWRRQLTPSATSAPVAGPFPRCSSKRRRRGGGAPPVVVDASQIAGGVRVELR
ncbi:MAG TPA: hypothetical protein VHG28_09300 [Longimicrobiaceae bacterium]|nr:hypothetical protein [Longimicrobiaceae bacterium]